MHTLTDVNTDIDAPTYIDTLICNVYIPAYSYTDSRRRTFIPGDGKRLEWSAGSPKGHRRPHRRVLRQALELSTNPRPPVVLLIVEELQRKKGGEEGEDESEIKSGAERSGRRR